MNLKSIKQIIKECVREALVKSSLDRFTRDYIEVALALSDSSYTYNHGPEKQSWEPGYEEDAPTGEEEHQGEPLSKNYGIEDIEPNTLKEMIRDCKDFQAKYREFYEAAGWDEGLAGHDFWLTRNHHGAGFWDRSNLFSTVLGQEKGEKGIEQVRKILTKAAHSYGEYTLYLGDGAYDEMVCGSKG